MKEIIANVLEFMLTLAKMQFPYSSIHSTRTGVYVLHILINRDCIYLSHSIRAISHHLKVGLAHISLASFLWDIGKQCRPRSDATECLHCVCLQND